MDSCRAAIVLVGLSVLGLIGPNAQAMGQEPPTMPEAPKQFKLSGNIGALYWEETADRGDIDSDLIGGLEIERLLLGFVAVRAGGAYGKTALTHGDTTTDLAQYVLDFSFLGRAAFDPLNELGLVPFVSLTFGAVIHDPSREDLITRSQTALGYGAGLELGLTSRIGVQAEWRHYSVNLQDALAPEDRESAKVGANRIVAGFFWRF